MEEFMYRLRVVQEGWLGVKGEGVGGVVRC
jgi:hypothetical protein